MVAVILLSLLPRYFSIPLDKTYSQPLVSSHETITTPHRLTGLPPTFSLDQLTCCNAGRHTDYPALR
jgi:hypothetical protein